MPQRLNVKKLYMICTEVFHKKLLEFCKNLDRSSICAKYGILLTTKRFLAEKLPKR